MKIALCQTEVSFNKEHNLRNAQSALFDAAQRGAQLAILPEMFNMAYVPERFHTAAEACPDPNIDHEKQVFGQTSEFLAFCAQQTQMLIVGGSIAELVGDCIYNTSLVFGPDGRLLGRYRKAHLFDVHIPGKLNCMESDFVAPGNDGPLVIAEPIQMGVSICFDVRFAEWMHLFMEAGADLIALPAAFSPATGPKHWELLLRARALDNQLFIAGVSPAQSPYAYGHSLIATPDGQVQYALGERAETAVWDIDLSAVPSMRESIPLRTSRRTDLYNRVRN